MPTTLKERWNGILIYSTHAIATPASTRMTRMTAATPNAAAAFGCNGKKTGNPGNDPPRIAP